MQDYLAIIIGPVAVGLFFLLIGAWWKIRCLQNDKKTLLRKVAQLDKIIADSSVEHQREVAELTAQKDGQIKRQQQEIENLHNELVPFRPIQAAMRSLDNIRL